MSSNVLNESTVEDAALSWFHDLGYELMYGPEIAPGEAGAERDSFGDVVLVGRLREAIDRLNPTIPAEAREEALRKVLRPESPSLTGQNRRFHRMLRDGVPVEYRRQDLPAPRPGCYSVYGIRCDDGSIYIGQTANLEQRWGALSGYGELLRKLLSDEVKTRSRKNVVQARSFAEMLQKSINAYHNRAIATQEVIDELIQLAKEMHSANERGEDLGLTDDELAFYDALAQNESAIEVLGIDELKVIATELVTQVRSSVTIDWTIRESARAKIRVLVRRILRKHGYPPDLQAEATKLVLEQAEVLCREWA